MTERTRPILVGIAMATGLFLTSRGLAQMQWIRTALWPYVLSVGPRYAALLIASAAIAAVGLRRTSLNPIVAGGVLCGALVLASGALWPLIVTVWFATSCVVLGKGFLAALRLSNSIDCTVSFLVGAGIYGSAVGLLAHFPVNHPGVYGAALMAPLIVGRHSLQQLAAEVRSWCAGWRVAQHRVNWLDASIAVVALVHVVVALMPEVGHDALVTHLFVPAHLAMRQQWGFDVGTYVWAVMPMLGDWIFSIAYMLAGETAARLTNVAFILLLAWLIRDLVIWAGGTASGARWAGLIFLSTPLTFTVSSSLFVESIWAAFVVAGALVILRLGLSEESGKADLAAVGILLGCALAAKAVASTAVLPLLVILVCLPKGRLTMRSSRQLLVGLALLVAFGASPYVRAWWLTGNPVFPFFNAIFQSPHYPAVNFEPPPFAKGLRWDTIYQVTFNSGMYLEARAGAAGFQWLPLLVPAIVSLTVSRQRRGLALVVAAILPIALTFSFTAYLRYIFASVALLCAVVGLGFSGEFGSSQLRKCTLAVGSLVVLLNMAFLNAGAFYGDFPIRSIFGGASRQAYLQSRLPIRNAVVLVNSLNPSRTPVAVFAPPLTAGLEADALYANWYNHNFQSQISAAATEHAVAQVLVDRGVDFVILDPTWGSAEKRRLIEQATESVADWGLISVRTVSRAYRFGTEMLADTTFSAPGAWTLAEGATLLPGKGVLVSVVAPATQTVTVTAGQRYLMRVTARSEGEPTQARMQINWLNAKGRFLQTTIRVFDCTDSLSGHSMEVVAPRNATFAVVYATGHTLVPVVFTEVSLRR